MNIRSREVVRRKRLIFSEEARTALLALLPSFLVFAVFIAYPVFYSLFLSFQEWSLTTPVKAFVGLGNYLQLLRSRDFLVALKNTVSYSIGTVPVGNALSLGVAILLNEKMRGLRFYRVAYFMPTVTSMIAVAVVWMWIYDPYYGLLNALLRAFGINGPAWLADPRWAMPAMILLSIWKNLGYNMVIFLAGLQDIPAEYYEAAGIDGAGAWQKFIYVTLPSMKMPIAFGLIMGTIRSFQVFGQIYVMTGGGPMNATMVIVYYLYRQAFEFFRMGYASAAAWVLFLIILSLTLVQNRLLRHDLQ